jgi:tRNA threonylcarbamoyladenosine biosynthesis protein TsaE
MNHYFVINSLSEIEAVAEAFIREFGEQRLFAFYGEMGVGKTTFIKSLCKVLGVKTDAKSPTFSMINVYKDNQGQEIYHFDCYRIENITDLMNIGYEEYFNSGNYCFIEWAENAEAVLTQEVVRVKMTLNEFDQSRIIQVL